MAKGENTADENMETVDIVNEYRWLLPGPSLFIYSG